MEQPSEHDAKLLFAAYLHKTGKPGEAIRLVAEEYGWPTHDFAATAITLSKRWERDDVVLAEIQRLKTIIPSKEETINDLQKRANQAAAIGDYKAYSSIMRVLVDTAGFVVKISTSGSKNEGTDDNFDETSYNVPPIIESEPVVVDAAPATEQQNNG